MFDEGGTSFIRLYFGDRSFEFTIADALTTINPLTGKPFLNRFRYYPIFVSLTDDEHKKYSKVSQQIAIMKSKDEYDPEDLQKLYEKRAEISKNAINKLDAYRDLILSMNPPTIMDTITFVSDKQIEPVFDILSAAKVKRAKITESESDKHMVGTLVSRLTASSQFVRLDCEGAAPEKKKSKTKSKKTAQKKT